MVRRSPQKKRAKAGAKPGTGPSGPPEPTDSNANEASSPTAVNWLASSGAAPSLAPEGEPWTPTGHRGEWATARSPMRSPTKPLEQQVSSLQAQREAADADLWNARVELQDHAQQKEADKERIAKLTTELARLRSEYEHDSQALDELRSREAELQSHLERERTKAARDRQMVREQLEDRDGYIDSLQSQVDELREELKATSRAAAAARRHSGEDTSGDVSSGAGDITSITIDSDVNVAPPEPSEVPQTVGASELLSQTHQARQQRSLRAALQKQRLENFQLKQQLAELKGAPVPQWEDEQQQDSDAEHTSGKESSELGRSQAEEFFDDGAAPDVPLIPTGVPLSEDFVDEAQLQREADHLNLAVVPEKELAELRDKHSDEASLDSLTTQLRKKYDAHVVPSDELEALRNPGMDLLHHQADAINHRLVPIREYEEMRNTQATSAKLKLTDEELKLAYELLRGRRRSKSKVQSHVLQDLARNQTLGLAPEVSHYYGDTSRDPSVSPSRAAGKHHRTASHSSSISEADSGYGDAQSLHDGVGTALRQIAQNHGFELVSDTVAGSRELAQRHGLVTVPLESLAVLSNSKIVSGESAPSSLQINDVILSLSRDEAERIQGYLAGTSNISKEELSELQRRAYTPNSADITEQAAALGLAVLPLEAVAEMKGQLRQRSVPDASTVAVMAEKAGLRVIPQHPTLDELRDIAPEDAVLVERDTWAALEYPEPATLRRLAKAHGLVVLPEKEVERMQHVNTEKAEPGPSSTPPPLVEQLSVDQLRTAAQMHDLVVLSAEDYREILVSRQPRDFSHLPMAARTEHFEKLIKSSQEARASATSPRGSPSASSLGSLSDRITRLGFVPVEQEEYQRLLASQKVYEPTKSDILRSAKQFGLAVMPLEDALRLRNSHWNSPTKASRDTSFTSTGSPRAETGTGRPDSPVKTGNRSSDDEFEGFKAVPSEYLAALRRIVEQPTRSDVEGLARKAGIAMDASKATDDEVIKRAKDLGLILPSETRELSKVETPADANDTEVKARARELGWSKPLSKKELLEKAKSYGLVDPMSEAALLEKAKSLGLAEPLTERQIIEKAKAKGLVEPVTNELTVHTAISLASEDPSLRQIVVDRAHELALVQAPSDDDIREQAKKFGFVEPPSDETILARAELLGHTKPLTDAEIRDRAKALGLFEPLSDAQVLAKARKLGLVEPLTEDGIRNHALTLGLRETLSEPEILEQAKKLGLIDPPTNSDIIAKAKSLGLCEPLSDAQIRQKGKSLGLVEPYSKNQLMTAAKELGLVEPLSDDEILEKAKYLGLVEKLSDHQILEYATNRLGLVHPLSEKEILSKAQDLGLSYPLSEKKLLESAKSKGLVEPYTDSQIMNAAKNLGWIDPLNESEFTSIAKSKGLVEPYSDEKIRDAASKLGLVEPLNDREILQAAKSKGLIEPYTETQVRDLAKEKGLVEPLSEFDLMEAAKSKGLVERYSDTDIIKSAKKLGLVDPRDEKVLIDHAKSLGLIEPYTDDQLREAAKTLGLAKPLSDDEVIEAAKAKGLIEPYTDDQLREAVKGLGLAEPLSDDEIIEAAKAKGLIEPYTDDQLREAVKGLGLVEPLSDDEVIEAAKAKGLIEPYTDDQLREAVKGLGLVEPLSDNEIIEAAKAKGLIEPYTDAQLREAVKGLGLVEPLSDIEIIEAAKAKGLIEPYTDAQLREAVKGLGLVEPLSDIEIIEAAKAKGLIEPYSDSQIQEAAKHLGMMEPLAESELLSFAKSKGLAEPLTEAQILDAAKARGLTEPLTDAQILEEGKSRGLVEPLTRSELVEVARAHGLVEQPTESEIKTRGRQLGLVEPYTESEIVANAKRLGLVEPPAELGASEVPNSKNSEDPVAVAASSASHEQNGEFRGSDTVNTSTDGEMTDFARSSGFLLPIDQDKKAHGQRGSHSRQTSEIPTGAAAAAIGPRAPIRTQHEGSGTVPVARKPVGSSTAVTPVEDQATVLPPPIPQRVRTDRGRLPNLDSVHSVPQLTPKALATPLSETSDSTRGDPSVVYGPDGPGKLTSTGLPQRLGGSPVRRSVRHYELASASRSPTRGMSRSNTSSSLHGQQNRSARGSHSSTKPSEALNLPMPRSSSFHPHGAQSRYAGSLAESVGSSWAVETVTGETAELNVSQIVVGEVLHKYTSGFNFEGITGGRHKRYFWFRPESMTLYWHRENPHFLAGFYGPAKCVTVIGVEEIPDRNPLPAGLFHRTILIKGRERNLRVTCSTASRHQVWYSTLRYVLAERNQTPAENRH